MALALVPETRLCYQRADTETRRRSRLPQTAKAYPCIYSFVSSIAFLVVIRVIVIHTYSHVFASSLTLDMAMRRPATRSQSSTVVLFRPYVEALGRPPRGAPSFTIGSFNFGFEQSMMEGKGCTAVDVFVVVNDVVPASVIVRFRCLRCFHEIFSEISRELNVIRIVFVVLST